MDSEAINPAKRADTRPAKPPAPSAKPVASAPVQNANPAPDDTVSLSPAAKEALETSAPATAKGSGNATASSGSENSRKLQVTEGHEVVLKIVDNKTREVVKQIPSEEAVQLKSAIRDNIENITSENKPTDELV